MARRRLPRQRREHLPVPAPVGGLKYDLASTMIEPAYTPTCEEVVIGGGMIRKAHGARYFAGTDSSALNGSIMLLTWLQSKLVCHTTTKVYWLVAGSFVDKTDAGGPYTGDEDNPISTTWMDSLYIWSNGVDTPRKWDLSGDVEELDCSTHIPAWLLNFGGRLCFYNVDDVKNRVRWTVVGDPEDYAGAGSGTADLDAEMDANDEMQRAERLGNYAVIYGKYSIALQEYRGEYTAPFGFHSQVPNVGLIAPRALINLHGREHIFLGREDVYSYTGGREARGIGKGIREQLFEEIDPTYANRSFMVYLQSTRRIRIHFPTLNNSYPSAYFELNLEDMSWTRGTRSYTGFGEYVVEDAPTWDELEGSWDSQTWRWDDRRMVTLAPLILYGNYLGEVMIDGDARDHLGAAITSRWDTKDFVQGPEYRRTITNWMGIVFEARGDWVTVSYSTDGGNNYKSLGVVELMQDWADYELHFEASSEMIRFRFENSSSDQHWQLRYYEVGYLKATEKKEEIE